MDIIIMKTTLIQ